MSLPTEAMVISSGNEQVSNTTPVSCLASLTALPLACSPTFWPNSSMEPASGYTRPRMALMVVVLPAPFEPMKPTTLPCGTVRSTFCRSNPS